MKTGFYILALLVLVHCASNPARKALQIQPGMTKQEVAEIAGEPTDRTFVGTGERWVFQGEGTERKVVLFRGGKVVSLESETVGAANSPETGKTSATEHGKVGLPCVDKNQFGSFAEGGGCNMYGCYPPGGYCNSFGCSAQGNCTNKKCPKPIESYHCID
jgi:hypothetical protein